MRPSRQYLFSQKKNGDPQTGTSNNLSFHHSTAHQRVSELHAKSRPHFINVRKTFNVHAEYYPGYFLEFTRQNMRESCGDLSAKKLKRLIPSGTNRLAHPLIAF
jgi:hypothetical protein